MSSTQKNQSLIDYENKAKEAFVEYLKRSTRFEIDNIKFHSSNAMKHEIQLYSAYQLDTILEYDSGQGRPTSSSNDYVYHNNSSQYNSTSEQLHAQETSRSETIEELAAHLKVQPFATVKEKYLVRTCPSRVINIYTCSSCNGNGNVTCGTCRGNGTVTCGSCGGSAVRTCGTCSGSGSTRGGYHGFSWEPNLIVQCKNCGGNGKERCSSCNNGRRTCSNCSGRGTVRCSTCNGHGELYKKTVIKTVAIPHFEASYQENHPSYLPEIVEEKSGITSLEKYAQITFIDVYKHFEDRVVGLRHDAFLNVAEFDVEINGDRTKVILFGKDFNLFDAGGVLDNILRDDLNDLSALEDKPSHFMKFDFQKAAEPVLINFMESEVHQMMVDHANDKSDIDQMYEKLDRALTKEHIDESMDGLKFTLKTISRSISIKYFLGIFVISLLSMLIYSLIFHSSFESYELVVIDCFDETFMWSMLSFIGITFFSIRWIYTRWLQKVGKARLSKFADVYSAHFNYLNLLGGVVIALIFSSTFLNAYVVDFFEGTQSFMNTNDDSVEVKNDVQETSNQDLVPHEETSQNPVIPTEPEVKNGDEPISTQNEESAGGLTHMQSLEDGCEKGDDVMCGVAGRFYKTGATGNVDLKKATYYLKKACDMGYKRSCEELKGL